MKKRNNSKKDSIRIMDNMIGELSELGDQGRKILKAKKKITSKLQKIVDVNDEEINKNLAQNEEEAKLLQQARDGLQQTRRAISQLRILWRQRH